MQRATRVPSRRKLLPHFPRAVHLVVLIPDALDRRPQLGIALRPRRSCRRLLLLGLPQEVRGRSDGQDRADRLDSVHVSVLIDEGDHHFARRSSSA